MTIFTTGAYDFPANADRNRTSMMLAAGDGPLDVIDGVHSGLALTKATGMGFNVGPGRAAVNGASALDGTFAATITANEPGSFEAGDPTRDRVDVVVLKSYPANPATTGMKVEVIKGAYPGSGSPVPPTVPAGSLALFEVAIPAGMSAANGGWDTTKIVDRRRKIGVPEFTSYTPTWSGFSSIGTGAVREGRYRLDGDKCSVNVHLRGGSGASMGTASFLSFDLPFPAATGWLYYGNGGLHHPNLTGLAYDLRVVSNDSNALVWAMDGATGALSHPGNRAYPFGNGTEVFCNLEYIIA